MAVAPYGARRDPLGTRQSAVLGLSLLAARTAGALQRYLEDSELTAYDRALIRKSRLRLSRIADQLEFATTHGSGGQPPQAFAAVESTLRVARRSPEAPDELIDLLRGIADTLTDVLESEEGKDVQGVADFFSTLAEQATSDAGSVGETLVLS